MSKIYILTYDNRDYDSGEEGNLVAFSNKEDAEAALNSINLEMIAFKADYKSQSKGFERVSSGDDFLERSERWERNKTASSFNLNLQKDLYSRLIHAHDYGIDDYKLLDENLSFYIEELDLIK